MDRNGGEQRYLSEAGEKNEQWGEVRVDLLLDQDNPYNEADEEPVIYFNDASAASLLSAASEWGFHHNGKRNEALGRKLAKQFGLTDQDSVLEVGWGDNHYIAKGMSEVSRSQVTLLDFNNGEQVLPRNEFVPVRNGTRESMAMYTGNFGLIDQHDSPLRGKLFDLVMMNGSWVSGGNNWTAKHIAESIRHQEGVGEENSLDWQNSYDRQFLAKIRDVLGSGGWLYISSSRFAYHGAGYGIDQLIEEKLEFLDLIGKLSELKPREMQLVGRSDHWLNALTQRNLTTYQNQRAALAVVQILYDGFRGKRVKSSLRDLDPSVVLERFKDPHERDQVFSPDNPVGQLLSECLMEQDRKLMTFNQQLSGGVEELPDDLGRSWVMPPERIRVIKHHPFMVHLPSNVSIIDAVAVRFS